MATYCFNPVNSMIQSHMILNHRVHCFNLAAILAVSVMASELVMARHLA